MTTKPKKTKAERFGEFVAYTLIAVVLIAFLATAYAWTSTVLRWSFGQ